MINCYVTKLLSNYSWSNRVRVESGCSTTALLLPNDFGLFDVYGNAREWVMDMRTTDPPIDGTFDNGNVSVADQFAHQKGGAFVDFPEDISTYYSGTLSKNSHLSTGSGFRIARTINNEQLTK